MNFLFLNILVGIPTKDMYWKQTRKCRQKLLLQKYDDLLKLVGLKFFVFKKFWLSFLRLQIWSVEMNQPLRPALQISDD